MIQNCNKKLSGEIDVSLNSNSRRMRSVLTLQLLTANQQALLLVAPLYREVEGLA